MKHLENNFKTAIESGYSRNLRKADRQLLAKKYKEITGNGMDNINCYKCMLEMLKVVGEWYFKEKENDERRETVECEEGSITYFEGIFEEDN